MPRLIAFLRAINVGGHTVKMADLRRLFESLGFSAVETFIASGNVVFETKPAEMELLGVQIEKGLHEALGYEVPTFLRSPAELCKVVAFTPFPSAEVAKAKTFSVAFLAEPLNDADREKVMALTTHIDDFRVRGREVYWMCGKKQSESTFSNALLERTLGARSTLRSVSMLKRMVGKYGFADG